INPHGLYAENENGFVPLSPCPPQAGCWCSRLERRPYVRLIVLGNGPRHAIGLGPRIPQLPSEFDLCTNESHPLTRSSPCEGYMRVQPLIESEPALCEIRSRPAVILTEPVRVKAFRRRRPCGRRARIPNESP